VSVDIAKTYTSAYGFRDEVDEYIAGEVLKGFSMAAVARSMRVTYKKVYDTCNHPAFMDGLQRMKEEMLLDQVATRNRIEILASVAVDKLGEILHTSENQDVARKAANDLIGLSSIRPITEVRLTRPIEVPAEQAEAMNAAFYEVKAHGNGNGNGQGTAGDGPAAESGPDEGTDSGAGAGQLVLPL
jgi:hypothetical protein